MSKFILRINPFAEDDLEESKAWYDIKKEGLGNEFLSDVKETITRIKENPSQFPKVRNEIRAALTNRFPFILFFYVKDLIINVFAVFHTSRNPRTWRKRIIQK